MADQRPPTEEEIYLGARAIALRDLGLVYNPKKRYQLKSFYDTQLVPTAASTVIDVFNTTTSSRSLHAMLVGGCNLAQVGIMDLNNDFLLLGIACQFVDLNAGTVALANDVAILTDYGIIDRFWVNEQVVLDEIFLAECPDNRGFTSPPAFIGSGAAAVDFDSVCNGSPGLKGFGYELAPWQRPYIKGGEKIHVEVTHRKVGTALSAARMIRLKLWGVEIENR